MLNLRNPRITIGTMRALERELNRPLLDDCRLTSIDDLTRLLYLATKPECTYDQFCDQIEPEEFGEQIALVQQALQDFFTRVSLGMGSKSGIHPV